MSLNSTFDESSAKKRNIDDAEKQLLDKRTVCQPYKIWILMGINVVIFLVGIGCLTWSLTKQNNMACTSEISGEPNVHKTSAGIGTFFVSLNASGYSTNNILNGPFWEPTRVQDYLLRTQHQSRFLLPHKVLLKFYWIHLTTWFTFTFLKPSLALNTLVVRYTMYHHLHRRMKQLSIFLTCTFVSGSTLALAHGLVSRNFTKT